MRRAISALAAALALVLTLVTPALAAGRPNWDGPLGAMAGPVVCETGRDYVLYYTIIGGVYRSADGVTWTELDRQWASAGWAYGTGVNGLAHKEFQFLWTGSEYMMRQSLLDDPPGGHPPAIWGLSPQQLGHPFGRGLPHHRRQGV